MKYFIQAIVLVAGFIAVIALAEAQVYVPGGAPVCSPQVVATPQGLVTVIVCQ